MSVSKHVLRRRKRLSAAQLRRREAQQLNLFPSNEQAHRYAEGVDEFVPTLRDRMTIDELVREAEKFD